MGHVTNRRRRKQNAANENQAKPKAIKPAAKPKAGKTAPIDQATPNQEEDNGEE